MNILKCIGFKCVCICLSYFLQYRIFFFLIQNSKFNGYKYIVESVFLLSVAIVFISVVLLIAQSVKVFNQTKIIAKNVFFLIINTVLYYFVVLSSLILSTQFPHLPDLI